MLKPCVECGELSHLNRCKDHRLKPTATYREKGYDSAWDRLSTKARKLQPWCSDCGATEGLECDHSPEAWLRKERGQKIRLQDVDVVCGPCNRARGSARPWRVGVDGGRAESEGKAKFGTHTPGGSR